MDLFALQQQLGALTDYPLEQWQPAFCGPVPIRIDRDGSWYFHGSPIQRPELVRLFAAVLSCVDGRYLLTTPAEQVQIEVDDAPFLLVDAVWLDDGRLQLTFEIVYGHAFKPLPRLKAGEASAISLDDMRAMLRTPRGGG